MNIRPVNLITRNPYLYKSPEIKTCKKENGSCGENFPALFYTGPNINFAGTKLISLKQQMERIDFDILPKRIQDRVRKELEEGGTKNLYELHKETYSPLLECKTLDEAKAMFPEFEGVIDAKDLAEAEMTTSIKKIKRGRAEGIKIEDLSLELLKSHYGRGLSPSHYREFYFGFSKETIFHVLEVLNIERLNGQYLFLVNSSSPERRAKNSAAWTPEKRAAYSVMQTEKWSDEGKRRKLSEKKKQYHLDHPEIGAAQSERMRGRKETPEHRARISKGVKKYRETHPEVTAIQQQAWRQHHDITQKMSEIAKGYPYLGVILEKRRAGISLSAKDLEYERSYYGKCEKEIPGFRTKVAATYKKMLDEYKKEAGSNND